MMNKQQALCLSLVGLIVSSPLPTRADGDLAKVLKLATACVGVYALKDLGTEMVDDFQHKQGHREAKGASTLTDDSWKVLKALGGAALLSVAIGEQKMVADTAMTGAILGGSWMVLNRAVKDHDIRLWPYVGAVAVYALGKAACKAANLPHLDFGA